MSLRVLPLFAASLSMTKVTSRILCGYVLKVFFWIKIQLAKMTVMHAVSKPSMSFEGFRWRSQVSGRLPMHHEGHVVLTIW
jgi:hypothetical protein